VYDLSIKDHSEGLVNVAVPGSRSLLAARSHRNEAVEHVIGRSLFHVYGDSPCGREELLQSAYFVRKTEALSLTVLVPGHSDLLMYCDSTVVTLHCGDGSSADVRTSRRHVLETLPSLPVDAWFFQTRGSGAGGLPEIPANWAVMAFPVSLNWRGIPASVGQLERAAASVAWRSPFPVFLPTRAFIPWRRVVALCVGSPADGDTAQVAHRITHLAEVPLSVFADRRRFDQIAKHLSPWPVDRFDLRDCGKSLYKLTPDTLLVVGAKKQASLMPGLTSTTHLTRIRAALPNPMLLIGPNCENGLLGGRNAATQDLSTPLDS
jgi:hypothetical protein